MSDVKPGATFDRYIGMDDDREKEPAHIGIQPHHCNPTGNVNGGVMISRAGNVSTGAANTVYFEKFGERKSIVGVDLHAVMLSKQVGERITAESTAVRVGRHVTVIQTAIKGDAGKVLADVTTTHVAT